MAGEHASRAPVAPPASDEARFEQSLLQFLLEHIPDRIYFKDAQSRFLKVSRALADFFSLADPADAVGRTDFDFFTREHAQPAFDDEQRLIRTGESIIGKIEKETLPDGRFGWAITTKMPLRDATGAVIGTCGISKDFTAQKALEDSLEAALQELRETHEKLKTAQRHLAEAEKIQSLGRLAFGVAHEVRNPLNTLNMAAEFLGRHESVKADPTMSAIVATMQNAVRQADAVIIELMDASGSTNLQLENEDIVPILESALARYEELFRRTGVAVKPEFETPLPQIALDPKRLEEIFTGLVQNAADAMPQGGRLTVRAATRRLAETEAQPDEGLRSARRLRAGDSIVQIDFEDNGPGIPEEMLTNIFDPFFTTKATGKGTGLGLTVCRKIVELHGGTIEVKNGTESGVEVSILLPAIA